LNPTNLNPTQGLNAATGLPTQGLNSATGLNPTQALNPTNLNPTQGLNAATGLPTQALKPVTGLNPTQGLSGGVNAVTGVVNTGVNTATGITDPFLDTEPVKFLKRTTQTATNALIPVVFENVLPILRWKDPTKSLLVFMIVNLFFFFTGECQLYASFFVELAVFDADGFFFFVY
jgi:hypothetical protein